MDEMGCKMEVGVGGIWVQPLWMDGMEKVVGVWAYVCNHCGWMGWKRWWGWVDINPTWVVQAMVKPLGWKVVSQEMGQGGQGLDFPCSWGKMMGGMSVVVVNGRVVVQDDLVVNEATCIHIYNIFISTKM
jgi:hypothetical protein